MHPQQSVLGSLYLSIPKKLMPRKCMRCNLLGQRFQSGIKRLKFKNHHEHALSTCNIERFNGDGIYKDQMLTPFVLFCDFNV